MVSVCTTCSSLQKHLKHASESSTADVTAIRWVDSTLPGLRRSSAGCRACALLLQGILLHHGRFANVREQDVRVIAESFSSRQRKARAQDHLSVELRWRAASDEDNSHAGCGHEQGYPDLKLELFTDGDGQSSYSAIGQGRPISEDFLHDSGLQVARNMIGECLSNHARCRPTKTTTLPKRILDVLIDGPSSTVRLHESAYNEDERRYEFGEYLALSYCWGAGKGVPQTTSKTLQAHKRGIPWKSLPKTFQEAILLTRSRGFRWLWIDALCIVQDDPQEKLQMSLDMAQIFGNAFVTIGATSACDTSQGLFPHRKPPFKLQTKDNRGALSKIYVREQPSHYSFKAPFDEGSHMNDWELPFNPTKEANLRTPLLKRAWAYSERLLSPRVMHFTESELILECKEVYQCECARIDSHAYDSRTTDSVKREFARIVAESSKSTDTEMTDDDHSDRRIDSVASQLAATSIADVAQSLTKKREEAFQLWSYIVTEYTARQLSYDADRLLAIASVAHALARAVDCSYIAGQWTQHTLGLLWYPNESAQCRRPKQVEGFSIPSWSWASIEGSPIFFDNASAMDLACSASFPDERSRDHVWSPTSGHNLELTASMATEVTFRVNGEDEYSLVRNNRSVEFRPDISPRRGQDALVTGDSLVCVLASMTFRSSIVGLVLKQTSNSPTQYRRVGRFECYEVLNDGCDDEAEDAETLFEHWFPEVEDMTQLDDGPQRTFTVV